MIKMKKQQLVEHTTQRSVENIVLNLVLISIRIYQASFQPDNKKSPQKAKIGLLRLIHKFKRIAIGYGDEDKAFSMQEIISDISNYHFNDAEYSTLKLRQALTSPALCDYKSLAMRQKFNNANIQESRRSHRKKIS